LAAAAVLNHVLRKSSFISRARQMFVGFIKCLVLKLNH